MSIRFERYELRTTDVAAARAFYLAVLGVEPKDVSPLAPDALARGARPHWLGHLGVDDLEQDTDAFVARGATRLGPTRRTPEGSLVAVLRDPGGAVVALAPRASTPPRGDVVWQVLNGTDMERTSGAYCELFGWRRTERLVLPLLGTFHRFAWEASGPVVGAFADIAGLPARHPHWLFHFRVERLDATMEAIRSHGGRVLPPIAVPSGHRIAVCEDAQGGAFALREDP